MSADQHRPSGHKRLTQSYFIVGPSSTSLRDNTLTRPFVGFVPMSRQYDSRVISLIWWAMSNVETLLGQVMLNARLTVKLRRHIGPELVCVQEIDLHSLSRIVFKYQTTHDHKILTPWRAFLGGIWELLSRFYHWKTSARVKCQRVLHLLNRNQPCELAPKIVRCVKCAFYGHFHNDIHVAAEWWHSQHIQDIHPMLTRWNVYTLNNNMMWIIHRLLPPCAANHSYSPEICLCYHCIWLSADNMDSFMYTLTFEHGSWYRLRYICSCWSFCFK